MNTWPAYLSLKEAKRFPIAKKYLAGLVRESESMPTDLSNKLIEVKMGTSDPARGKTHPPIQVLREDLCGALHQPLQLQLQ